MLGWFLNCAFTEWRALQMALCTHADNFNVHYKLLTANAKYATVSS